MRLKQTVWVDVEDLFEYARSSPRPSGIQRLAFEIYSVLQARYGSSGGVRFVRHDPIRGSFETTPWRSVETLFEGLTHPLQPPPLATRLLFGRKSQADVVASPASVARRGVPIRVRVQDFVHHLPPPLRDPVLRYRVLQPAALRALGQLVAALLPARRSEPAPAPEPHTVAIGPDESDAGAESPAGSFRACVRPGDILLVLGAPWFHPDYDRLLAVARARHGMRVALLVYDLIPLRRPEWCDRHLVRQFTDWFTRTARQCDKLFAISRATAADVELYARQNGLALPGPVQVIPIGTGFNVSGRSHDSGTFDQSGLLPAPGSYVLFVSTIEARKNHELLFRVWRRLLEALPQEEVPTLVFAGRVGWLVADLMQQLENANYLDGRIRIVCDPTDTELRALYQSCLFTVLPSMFEGWGLPVTESLALGIPCVIANNTSLPEAGGSLARYFDAGSVEDAFRVIRATIADRPGLSAWRDRIAREFRPVSWESTVQSILAGLSDDALTQTFSAAPLAADD